MKRTHIRAKAPWFFTAFKDLIPYREVFTMLVLRDFKLRYKQTVLGVLWVLLQPLLTALLFTLIFGKAIRLPTGNTPYLLFALSGLVPWLFFSQALQRASTSLIGDTRLITKVYFPRIFIPLSATFGVLIDFAITLALFFALASSMGHLSLSNLWGLPFAFLLLLFFSAGVNFCVSSLNVYYRDLKHMLPFIVQLWMYASPIVYGAELIPEKYRSLYSLNPLVGIIDTFRWALLGGAAFPWSTFAVAFGSSLLLFIGGAYLFQRIERYFADVI